MNYTINEVAQKFGLSAHTLRYYDKEGLLPFIERTTSGNRVFTDADLNWVALICCLKDTGMPIKEMKTYSQWATLGAETIDERKQMLTEHRLEVTRQIEKLQQNLKLIDEKIEFYNDPDNIELMEKMKERVRSRAN
ncbi:DNA-binding transcriptional MerR regulator [Paenibacillus taihuensis]|uniref:DNA-binding transcriptional MerR regulator n=1 Tax=Paenibacillus taihuensis TaxID=1156355 RepID=A0A3D9RU12_9BACL|nr:MerR family transcriptional regulator [Paenibacillus taihuensis]REE80185.1 DNA-binding transcriptional MerR regulator [Paenibacillus taihuensis]